MGMLTIGLFLANHPTIGQCSKWRGETPQTWGQDLLLPPALHTGGGASLLAGVDITSPLLDNDLQALARKTESKTVKENHGPVNGTSNSICWSTTASLWP